MSAADDNGPKPEYDERLREIVFSLSPARLVGGIVALCLGYAVVFFLGVVLGRGYTPESAIPELARLMPEAAPSFAPRVVAPEEENPVNGDAAPSSVPPDRNDDVPFTQADLDYRERLKSGRQAAPPVRSGDRAVGEAGRKGRGDAGKTAGAGAPQARQSAGGKAPERAGGAAKDGKNGVASPARAGALYRYVYQAASYKDGASGENFAGRLRAGGFNARTEQSTGNGVAWFRVMVEFTGRPADTDALREKLKGFGVPHALLRSKTPAD
jgi:cell division septation protein DedD